MKIRSSIPSAQGPDKIRSKDRDEQSMTEKNEVTVLVSTTRQYQLLGKQVKQEEYEEFRKSLEVEKDFSDERLPPQQGKAGGYGAIWQAVDASGVSYEINEYTLDDEQVYSIERVN